MCEFILPALNLNKVCRICLIEYENMFSIYSELFEESSAQITLRIHEVLNKISSIKVEPQDGLPKLVCSKCIKKAQNSYEFQLQCNRAQSFLNTYIEQLEKLQSKINATKQVAEENNLTEGQNIEANNNGISNTVFSEKNDNSMLGHKQKKANKIFEARDVKKINFEDDFNSDSDVFSLRGENIVNTDEILNRLDLISNLGNQEDLDLNDDEDCDDLKSCIPLGDDTVDQLIKDNLQGDNLDLITPKMEAFHFNMIGKSMIKALPKSSSKHLCGNCTQQIPSDASQNNSNTHVKCESDLVQFEKLQEQTMAKCFTCQFVPSYIKQNKIQEIPFVSSNINNSMETIKYIGSIKRYKVQPFSLDENDTNCINDTNDVNKIKSHLIEGRLNEVTEYNKVAVEHNIEYNNKTLSIEFESVTKSKSDVEIPASSDYANICFTNLRNECYPTSLQNANKTFQYESPVNSKIKVSSQNSENESDKHLINIVPTVFKTELISVENFTGGLKTDNSHQVVNKSTNLSASNIEAAKIHLKFPKIELAASKNINNDKSVLLRNPLTESETEPVSFQNDVEEIKDSSCSMKIRNKSINVNISVKQLFSEFGKNLPKSLKEKQFLAKSNTANPKHKQPKLSKPPVLSKNMKESKSDATLFKHSLKRTNIKPIFSKFLNGSQINPPKTLSKEAKPEPVFKSPIANKIKLESVPYKGPMIDPKVVSFNNSTVSKIQLKPSTSENLQYSCKSDSLQQPPKLTVTYQTPALLSFQKIRTFTLKPREPPNMNYYKSEKEDKTVEYMCNICQKKFRFAHNLRIHIKNHGLEKPFICTECKKDFKVYGSLVHHSRSHSGEQPFECQICGKRYKQSGTLTAHMRIHTGQKPYECKVCGKGFRQAPDLTYHMRTHTKEKPYMCTVCGKTMAMQCHLVQHMRSHTGEKPFKCLECGKAFPSSTRLKRHSVIHTNLKPYKCKVCNKAFNRNSSLQLHMKLHNDLRVHKCTICRKEFYWLRALKLHMTSHSKETSTTEKQTTTSDTTVLEETKSESPIIAKPLLDKDRQQDSFSILTTEDLNSLGLENFQILKINGVREGIETFTVYSSESTNDQLSLLNNSSIPLSAISL